MVEIGRKDFPSVAPSYNPRQNQRQRQIGPEYTDGLGALAQGIASFGASAEDYMRQRQEWDRQRKEYETLRRYQEFTGTMARRAEDLKEGLPPDGQGYIDRLHQGFNEEFRGFLNSVPKELVDKYRARAEGVKQNMLVQADLFERKATRGHALSSLEGQREQLRQQVYEDPSALGDAEESLAEGIQTAPGLDPNEKSEVARTGLQSLRMTSLAAQVRKTEEMLYVTPFSRTSGSVVPAIIPVESAGDPDEVSDAGAIGLMQVMPSTAEDIAMELGDNNFPFEGSAEKKREYLKGQGVNVRYGKYYFNKMLQRYNGDMELALVAYNGGPGRADAYVASGREPSSIPRETQEYVGKVFDELGMVRPEDAFEAGLNLDNALGMESDIQGVFDQARKDAAARTNAMREQAAREHEQTLQDIYLAAEGGGNGPQLYMQALEDGKLHRFDHAEYNKTRTISERVLGDQIAQQEALTAYSNPGAAISEEQANIIVGEDVRSGLLERDDGALEQALTRMDRIGFVPSETGNVVKRMLRSGNIQDVNFASQAISAMQERGVVTPGTFSDDELVRARSMNALRSAGVPQEQLDDYMRRTRTPSGMAEVATAKQNDEDYKEIMERAPSQILDEFNWGLLGINISGPAQLPEGPVRGAFVRQWKSLVDMYYAQTLDAGTARELATEHMGTKWGETSVDGFDRITFLPPEQVYSQVRVRDPKATPDRIDVYSEADTTVRVKLPPDEAARMISLQVRQDMGLGPDERFKITVGKFTEADIAAGRNPRYRVQLVNEEGDPIHPVDDPRWPDRLMNETWQFDYDAARNIDVSLQDQLDQQLRRLDDLQGDDIGTVRKRWKVRQEIARIRALLEEQQDTE